MTDVPFRALAPFLALAFGIVWAVLALLLAFETSESVQFWWTELADFEDRPKAWDGIVSPEFSASLRVIVGSFEATPKSAP